MKKVTIYLCAIAIMSSILMSNIPTTSAENIEEPEPFYCDEIIDTDRIQYPPHHHSPPGDEDTSEYMIGDVSVGIILLESDGTTDTSTENWTGVEMNNIFNKIQAACDWWEAIEPNAHLNFHLELHVGVPTSLEPITHNSRGPDEATWMNEAMTHLGYTTDQNNRNTGIQNYINNMRNVAGTDWGFVIFVVDSSNDDDHRFLDNWYAYARVGGPYIVMLNNNRDFPIDDNDAVCAHEIGHIFYARDEYASSTTSTATTMSGYLNIEKFD